MVPGSNEGPQLTLKPLWPSGTISTLVGVDGGIDGFGTTAAVESGDDPTLLLARIEMLHVTPSESLVSEADVAELEATGNVMVPAVLVALMRKPEIGAPPSEEGGDQTRNAPSDLAKAPTMRGELGGSAGSGTAGEERGDGARLEEPLTLSAVI